jgi:hypothetical protein
MISSRQSYLFVLLSLPSTFFIAIKSSFFKNDSFWVVLLLSKGGYVQGARFWIQGSGYKGQGKNINQGLRLRAQGNEENGGQGLRVLRP